MKHWKRKPSYRLILIGALLGLLPLLAILQYRWLGQLSQGERERMQANVHAAATHFAQDFDREVTRAYMSLQMDAATIRDQAWANYAQRYAHWAATTTHPRLVSSVLLAQMDENGQATLARFDESSSQFQPTGWPPELEDWRRRYEQCYHDARPDQGRPVVDGAQTDRIIVAQSKAESTARGPSHVTRLALGPMRAIEEDIPVLVIPVLNLTPPEMRLRPDLSIPIGYTIVTLNREYLEQEFIPALARRYFSGDGRLDYHLAVVSQQNPKNVIYRSDPDIVGDNLSSADATVGFFRVRIEEFAGLSVDDLPSLGQPAGGGNAAALRGLAFAVVDQRRSTSKPMFNVLLGDGGRWQLILKHRAGSLEAAVASLRRRNLLISFGILLLLAGSMVMIIISTHRAQRLAEQQMEFVAGVSHELRTPLTVICSAGENLADGVIHDAPQIEKYGALIRDEGRRLTEMVEQVLEFAGVQSGRKTYDLRPVEVGELIESALAACHVPLAAGGFQVEKNIAPHVPSILADAAALRSSIQNLLNNAMKYGGESRRIGVRAQVKTTARGPEVQITVQDHGLGIAPADLPHIFEPFYRGREVRDAQIHGSGLGLSLVKHVVEAHGGRVSVESTLGRGSSFMLHLPVSET